MQSLTHLVIRKQVHNYQKILFAIKYCQLKEKIKNQTIITSGRFASSGQASQFSVFLDSSTHPVDLRISPDGFVRGINHDNLKVLVCGVLSNPVRTEDSQACNTATNSFFSNGLQVTNRFLLLDGTRRFGFTVGATFGNGPFAASTTHSNAEDDEACKNRNSSYICDNF